MPIPPNTWPATEQTACIKACEDSVGDLPQRQIVAYRAFTKVETAAVAMKILERCPLRHIVSTCNMAGEAVLCPVFDL